MTTRSLPVPAFSALAFTVLVAVSSSCGTGSDAVDVPGGSPTADSIADSAPTTTEPAAPATSTTTTAAPTTTTPPPQTTAAPPTTAGPATTAERTVTLLRQGDEGPAVRLIQRKLIALGYLAAGSDTGVFDRATNGAVLRFQGDYGLVVDGLVGPQTERSISAAANSITGG